jgi:hypothetical protein
MDNQDIMEIRFTGKIVDKKLRIRRYDKMGDVKYV